MGIFGYNSSIFTTVSPSNNRVNLQKTREVDLQNNVTIMLLHVTAELIKIYKSVISN